MSRFTTIMLDNFIRGIRSRRSSTYLGQVTLAMMTRTWFRWLSSFHCSSEWFPLHQAADDDLRSLLAELEEGGNLKDTLVMVMSDHGHRWKKMLKHEKILLFSDLMLFGIHFKASLRKECHWWLSSSPHPSWPSTPLLMPIWRRMQTSSQLLWMFMLLLKMCWN